jgi:hypothetical protein
VESLRSLLCSCYKLDHPFQQIASETFTQQTEGELLLNQKINVDLNVDKIHIELE